MTVQSLESALQLRSQMHGVVNTKKAKLVSYHVPRAEAKSMSGMLVKRSITMRSVRPGLP